MFRDGRYETVKMDDAATVGLPDSALRVVYENGQILVDDSLEEIRRIADLGLRIAK